MSHILEFIEHPYRIWMVDKTKIILYTLSAAGALAIGIYVRQRIDAKNLEDRRNNIIRTKGFIMTLLGGLGNQLFIYAAALGFKKKFNVPVYLLSDAGTQVHTRIDYRLMMKGVESIEYSDERVMYSVDFDFPSDPYVYGDYDDDKIPVEEPRYILFDHIYFQRFEKIKDSIPAVKEHLLPFLQCLYKDVKVDSDSSAFLHVRRGDYLTDSGGARMVAKDYYGKGLDVLNTIAAIKTVYIISDDIAWCKQQTWKSAKKIEYFDDPDELKTLYFMSQCWAGAAISNSTFSLWGVFLGAHGKTNTIVYPVTKHFLQDLPASWIKI